MGQSYFQRVGVRSNASRSHHRQPPGLIIFVNKRLYELLKTVFVSSCLRSDLEIQTAKGLMDCKRTPPVDPIRQMSLHLAILERIIFGYPKHSPRLGQETQEGKYII